MQLFATLTCFVEVRATAQTEYVLKGAELKQRLDNIVKSTTVIENALHTADIKQILTEYLIDAKFLMQFTVDVSNRISLVTGSADMRVAWKKVVKLTHIACKWLIKDIAAEIKMENRCYLRVLVNIMADKKMSLSSKMNVAEILGYASTQDPELFAPIVPLIVFKMDDYIKRFEEDASGTLQYYTDENFDVSTLYSPVLMWSLILAYGPPMCPAVEFHLEMGILGRLVAKGVVDTRLNYFERLLMVKERKPLRCLIACARIIKGSENCSPLMVEIFVKWMAGILGDILVISGSKKRRITGLRKLMILMKDIAKRFQASAPQNTRILLPVEFRNAMNICYWDGCMREHTECKNLF